LDENVAKFSFVKSLHQNRNVGWDVINCEPMDGLIFSCEKYSNLLFDTFELQYKRGEFMKDAVVRARIESGLKESVEGLFAELGLSTSEAITLFYKQVELNRGLPFQIKLPNKETLEVFEATDKGEDLVYCDNAEDMFKKLGI